MQSAEWGPESSRKLAILVGALSMADLTLTLLGMSLGVVSEANPWMDALLRHSPPLFVGVKTGVTLFFLVMVGRYGGSVKWARLPTLAVCGVYLGVMALHARWIASALTWGRLL